MQNLSTKLAPPRLLTYHDPARLTITAIRQQCWCAWWPRGMLWAPWRVKALGHVDPSHVPCCCPPATSPSLLRGLLAEEGAEQSLYLS